MNFILIGTLWRLNKIGEVFDIKNTWFSNIVEITSDATNTMKWIPLLFLIVFAILIWFHGCCALNGVIACIGFFK